MPAPQDQTILISNWRTGQVFELESPEAFERVYGDNPEWHIFQGPGSPAAARAEEAAEERRLMREAQAAALVAPSPDDDFDDEPPLPLLFMQVPLNATTPADDPA